ncbi:MAG: alpha/beta hydrolase [Oscillospiraceae bacterium]|nr:alpha/beta hydrolase [Oscillospiraceae bacterium]
MIYNAKEDKIKTDEAEMTYITFGSGKKPLVIIQGFNTNGIKGTAVFLAYAYRIFAKDYKVYMFDRRENVYEGITVRDIAADIAAAMDKLEIGKADIFAVSQGGMIAQYLAVDRPDLVRKMVLAVTLSRNNDTLKKAVNNWIAMCEQGDIKALVRDMGEKLYSEQYLKRYKLFMPLLTIMQKPKDMRRFIILAKANLTCSVYDELDRIKCPVLVLGAGKDKIVTGNASEEIAERLGCDIYMYEELGHSAYEEAGDFNKRVYDFLIG